MYENELLESLKREKGGIFNNKIQNKIEIIENYVINEEKKEILIEDTKKVLIRKKKDRRNNKKKIFITLSDLKVKFNKFLDEANFILNAIENPSKYCKKL